MYIIFFTLKFKEYLLFFGFSEIQLLVTKSDKEGIEKKTLLKGTI